MFSKLGMERESMCSLNGYMSESETNPTFIPVFISKSSNQYKSISEVIIGSSNWLLKVDSSVIAISILLVFALYSLQDNNVKSVKPKITIIFFISSVCLFLVVSFLYNDRQRFCIWLVACKLAITFRLSMSRIF